MAASRKCGQFFFFFLLELHNNLTKKKKKKRVAAFAMLLFKISQNRNLLIYHFKKNDTFKNFGLNAPSNKKQDKLSKKFGFRFLNYKY